MTVDELLEVLSFLASRDEGFESQLRRLAEERVIEQFESRRETGHDLPVIVRVRCHAEKICLVHDLGEGFTIAVARAGEVVMTSPYPTSLFLA